MAQSSNARLIATPISSEEELKAITFRLDAYIHHFKKDDPLLREKIAQQLIRARKENPKAQKHSFKYSLIAMFEAVYDSFHLLPNKRAESNLDEFLRELSYHHQHPGFSKSAQLAIIYYFHHLLRKQEKIKDGFFAWFESYVLKWQATNVFGEGFDFDKWRSGRISDLLMAHRYLSEYPKKKWLPHNNPFAFYRRESSDEDLGPKFKNTDEVGSEFTIIDVGNKPLKLIAFLIEYNVLVISERKYKQLSDKLANASDDQQINILKKIFPNIELKVASRAPRVRIIPSEKGKLDITNNLSQYIIDKLIEGGVKVTVESDLPENIAAQTTQFFAASSNDAREPYVVHRIVQAEQHHFELVKSASLRVLEDYLTSFNVSTDRMLNAIQLFDNIKLYANSYDDLQRMLSISKQKAKQDDEEANATRHRFFHRHRFSSRYITLLDDLSDRASHCIKPTHAK